MTGRDPLEILQRLWGYPAFRPGQEEIVRTVLEGKDTLALLPTGGGKSISFQVPALCLDGVCLVISPLMALMFDQVENLKKKEIPAAALTSAMSLREADRTLEAAVKGELKFLYLSPERLKNRLFRERLKSMKPCLIAVDEAHCISQWGYDFRPAYLEVAEIREVHPSVPVIALTASATPRVVDDICLRLRFRNGRILRQSFSRDNLAYLVHESEDKEADILRLCRQTDGTGIVYCGTRMRTRQLAQWLSAQGISAGHYHAGLTASERDRAYRGWLSGDIRVICATNAFGMGIDKPDVRFVVHADVPANPESYFQEAGRAGRDGQPARALLLCHAADRDKLRSQAEARYPPKELIRKVWNQLGEHYRLAIGAGQDMTYLFDLTEFARSRGFRPTDVLSALHILESAGYLSLNDAAWLPSRIHFTCTAADLYRFQVAHPALEPLTRILLRMYGGLFEQYGSVREEDIARSGGWNVESVAIQLKQLQRYSIIDYAPRSEFPRLTFEQPRMDPVRIVIPKEVYEDRRDQEMERMRAMIRYMTAPVCRSRQLLGYFGEENAPECGKCDVCLRKKTPGISPALLVSMEDALHGLLHGGDCAVDELPLRLATFDRSHLLTYVRWKIEQGELILESDRVRMP